MKSIRKCVYYVRKGNCQIISLMLFLKKDEKAEKFMCIETGLGINTSYY